MQQIQRAAFVQEQRLSLKLSPQLIQSIKLMALPVAELREKIEEELERNPALEIVADKSGRSLDRPFVRRGNDAEAEEHRAFIEGALTRSETLQEHLLHELHLQPLDDRLRHAAELLIGNLSSDGFHREPPETVLGNLHPEQTSAALALVQALDPQGCATADYTESLYVQAALRYGKKDAGLIRGLLPHLRELEKGRPAAAARALKTDEDEVACLLAFLKDLNPFPGRGYRENEVRYVIPDLRVIRRDGRFSIILNNEEIPVLGIEPYFLAINEADKSDTTRRAARDFARENVKEARWFINSINQRNHTLLRVARAIVHFQRAFFADGPKYIAPLTLRDIASELDIHETTVSRAAGGKYMQTEWGIFELRHFFTNSISGAGSGGSKYSKEGVKEIIRELIGAETSAASVLSDQQISTLLTARGIPLARRTVAKYRKELNLDSSYERS